ncbi:NlpC/P60 family protein [Nonomuraea basaltis]|uniref:bifunctional WXG100 family type VII secretion target/C40 family peptidase n=1 Tax=Nonomuraea basaltis TaxID=2495887 RepID=UPI00110C4DD5|nr:NlpC/P60 family protein [Nonomuraea basaltis]TMR89958.1 hypothetical protein EJK15_57905 [Nonomuraea basaltis]
MDLATQIAQLPGFYSEELAAILRSVSGSPETIRGIATRWRSAAGKASEHAGRIGTAVTDVDHAWQGASADAFATYMGGYGKAGVALHDALKSSASSLDDAAQALETAKSQITSICNELLEYADRNSEDREAVAGEVSRAASAARPLQTRADSAVAGAMKEIKDHLGDREATFAAIKAPGDQTFVPAPGHTVDWTPAPVPEVQQTTFQSVSNGPSSSSYGPASSSYGPAAGSPGGSGGEAPQALPFAPGTGTGSRIVEAARQHLGKPYVWGANGPSAFDCSGLAFYSMNQAGIKIGDTTAAGYQASGQPVTSPQPGDMVFFGHPAGHMGIYIGDGKMIHAPRPGSEVMVGNVADDGRPVSYRRFT